ncbi:GIY-YIG nuclease family protein [Leptolyngbya sp. O-77]|uniref:GIY-YIG nuclease family protein n=1 Tax=Leptolyngbya sp. O-77 TaxID=1080068 RepID=UPI00074D3A07|nr:GIY-YIG nuclease family protein [Leptolyngbya sp. O-77]BAU41683.1 hypothetical protein O77CONTIG1_01495 [Leptolyngbya sp. O-77]
MPPLAELPFSPYLDDQGEIIHEFDGKVGAYAIFDADHALQYIGYSRDITASLLQHLVRVPQGCHWVKVWTCDRPSRTLLETIRSEWIAESGATPPGNGDEEAQWNQPIDAKVRMTPQEQADYASADDHGKIKTLKQVARRVEAEVLQALGDRGVTTPIRFDPKLKEEGLLGLKPV